jgi:uncharacterized protein
MYDNGQGTTQDYAEAIKRYRMAALQSDSKAQYNLGVMYDKGQGTTQDYAEALKWYRTAAVQGNSKAQFNLGLMYLTGDSLVQDNIRAHMWFNLSATDGTVVAAAQKRDAVARIMTKSQVMQAQIMASSCLKSNYKLCE